MRGIRVPICDVDPLDDPYVALNQRESIEQCLRKPLYAYELPGSGTLVSCSDANGFARAAHDAFFDHVPLTISPDDVWFCIAQGFAHHVKLNAESLRLQFVQHAGKTKLVVTRADFAGGPDDPWPEAFAAFSDQIAGHIGHELRNAIVADFSTTTPTQRAATEVLLMDAFQAYFDYEFLAGCGIPYVRLLGAPDDWRNVRRRAESFGRYGLNDWMTALLPVLDRIEATSRGHIDADFWKSFFRYDSGSGNSAMTGWIQTLFPYIYRWQGNTKALDMNPYIRDWWNHYDDMRSDKHWQAKSWQGPSLLAIPSALASAPVKLKFLNSTAERDIRFIAGMFGVAQDPSTLELSAAWGWAVVDEQRRVAGTGKRSSARPKTLKVLEEEQRRRRQFGG
jgi:hypothetical protein